MPLKNITVFSTRHGNDPLPGGGTVFRLNSVVGHEGEILDFIHVHAGNVWQRFVRVGGNTWVGSKLYVDNQPRFHRRNILKYKQYQLGVDGVHRIGAIRVAAVEAELYLRDHLGGVLFVEKDVPILTEELAAIRNAEIRGEPVHVPEPRLIPEQVPVNWFAARLNVNPAAEVAMPQFRPAMQRAQVLANLDDIHMMHQIAEERILAAKKPPRVLKEQPAINIQSIADKEILAFEKKINAKQDIDVCSFFTISEQGNVHRKFGTICHSDLFGGERPRALIYDEVRAYYRTSNCQLEYAEYVDYLINKSVFKGCFNTELDSALDTGVTYDLDEPGIMVYASAIMLRQPSEHAHQMGDVALFARSITDGDWIAAWVLAQLFSEEKQGVFTRGYWENRHRLFGETFSFEGMAKFFNKGPIPKDNAYWKPAKEWDGSGRWQTSDNLTGDCPGRSVSDTLAEMFPGLNRWGDDDKKYTRDDVIKVYNKYKEMGNA